MSLSDLNSESCFFDEFDLETGSDRNMRSGRNSTDEKKRIHNELERKRRGTIKENFDQLYFPSRAQILTRAINHITNIQAFDNQRNSYMSKIEADIKDLENELSRLREAQQQGEEECFTNDFEQIMSDIESRKPPKLDDFNLSFIRTSSFSGGFSSRISNASSGFSPRDSDGRLSNGTSKIDGKNSGPANGLGQKTDIRAPNGTYFSQSIPSDHNYLPSLYSQFSQNGLTVNQDSPSNDGSRSRRVNENGLYMSSL